MNLKDIEYFVALSHEGSFRKAAAQCKTSQPTISNSITRMEKELGTSLFKRTTRSLALTSKGVEILKCAQSILVNVNSMKDIARGSDTINNGINLGLTTPLSQYLYTSITELCSNLGDHPVKVHEIRKDKIKMKLDSGLMNCLLIACDEDLQHYDQLLVAQFPYFLAVSSDDELAGMKAVEPSEIKDRTMLGVYEDCPYDTSQSKILKKFNLKHETGLFFCTTEVLKLAILQKKGIALIPAYAANQDDGITYIPVNSKGIESKIHLVYRKDDVNKDSYTMLASRIGSVINFNQHLSHV